MAASMAGAVDLSALKQRANAPAAPAGDGSAPAAVQVTEANFETEVLGRSNQVPVVVLLWSPRSDICVEVADTLAQLAAADQGKWSLALVNVDATPQLAQVFGVEGVPTVVALAAGRPLGSFQGRQPADQLRKWIDSLLEATAGKLSGGGETAEAEQVDPALAAARGQLDSGDFVTARASYQAILEADQSHNEAKGAIRQIDWLARASVADPSVVDAADAAPDDIDAALAAADVQLLGQDVAGAFARLTGLIKRTAGDDRAKIRTRLLELFELFDPSDPDVIKGRRDLASALF